MGKKDGHDNLIPLNKRTKEVQREIQSKGGTASAIARREQKAMQVRLGHKLEKFAKDSKTGEVCMHIDIIADVLISEAENGNMKAIEHIGKIMAWFTDRHELTGADGQPLALQTAPPKKLTDEEMRIALEELRDDL